MLRRPDAPKLAATDRWWLRAMQREKQSTLPQSEYR